MITLKKHFTTLIDTYPSMRAWWSIDEMYATNNISQESPQNRQPKFRKFVKQILDTVVGFVFMLENEIIMLVSMA